MSELEEKVKIEKKLDKNKIKILKKILGVGLSLELLFSSCTTTREYVIKETRKETAYITEKKDSFNAKVVYEKDSPYLIIAPLENTYEKNMEILKVYDVKMAEDVEAPWGLLALGLGSSGVGGVFAWITNGIIKDLNPEASEYWMGVGEAIVSGILAANFFIIGLSGIIGGIAVAKNPGVSNRRALSEKLVEELPPKVISTKLKETQYPKTNYNVYVKSEELRIAQNIKIIDGIGKIRLPDSKYVIDYKKLRESTKIVNCDTDKVYNAIEEISVPIIITKGSNKFSTVVKVKNPDEGAIKKAIVEECFDF